MKILIIRPNSNPIDLDKYNSQEIGMAKALVSRGHECTIVMSAGKNSSYVKEVALSNGKSIKVCYLKSKSIMNNSLLPIKDLEYLIADSDIVQVNDREQLVSAYVLRKHPGKAYLYHGPYDSKWTHRYSILAKAFTPLYLGASTNIPAICKSKMAQDYLQKRGFRLTRTIGVGLDCEIMHPNENAVEKDPGLFLFVGNLCERKNLLFALKVIKRLISDGYPANLRVIGSEEDAYASSCKDFVAKNGIADNVAFLGTVPQSELCSYYQEASYILFPTRYDIFGMVLLEAMFFGCIPLSSSCGGTSVLIEDGFNGIEFNDYSLDEWVSSIEQVMDNAFKKDALSKAASKTVRKSFVWDKLVDSFLKFYDDYLIGG